MNSCQDKISTENEIDLKELIHTISLYKWMIIFFVIFFSIISAYIAYFRPSIYKATATVEVGLSEQGYYKQDILSLAVEPDTLNADTEIEIIKSRFLAKKASAYVDRTHHYYTTKNFRTIELYKATPFKVGMNKGFGIKFDFYPLGNSNKYRLIVTKAKSSDGQSWSYDKILPFDKEIITKYFHINITKVGEFKQNKYSFMIDNPSIINVDGVSAQQTTKYSTILAISYEDTVALRAKEYANALAHAYIQQNIEKKTQEATKKLEFIDNQLKFITQNLRSSAIKIEDFKKRSKTISLSAKAETIIKQISNKDAKLSEINIKEEILNNLYNNVKKGKHLESLVVVGLGDSEASLSQMIKKLQDAILKKKLLREDYTEMYPDVRKLSKTIVQLKKMIISTIKNMKKGMAEQKKLLQKEIAKQQHILDKLPADERMFGQLQRKFAVNEKVYSYLLEKRSETAIIKASTVSKNRIIDEAILPTIPIKPKRKLIVLVGAILGLIFGILVAFIRNYFDNTIKYEEDITEHIQIPMLGMIPHIQTNRLSKLLVIHKPKSALSEAFRNIRTNLQFMLKNNTSQVIAITSTISGEGKTIIAVNLGAIISMTDKKVIILNLDMRKPTLHEQFDMPNNQGMSSLLANNVSLNEVIRKTQYENIDIITSGPIPPNPSELIQSPLMEKILYKLKESYDVILLDTPPIGIVTDARSLMHLADMSIYIFRANYSKKEFIKSLKFLSSISDIHNLGVVLNDIKITKHSYGYHYGYGYYEEEKK